jgi:hypothetical protein
MASWWKDPKGRFAELRRRRVLRALGAYVLGGWVLLQVADVTLEPLGVASWVQRALIIAVFAGVVPAAILAWVFDFTRKGIVRTPDSVPGLDGSGAPPAKLAGGTGTAPASAPISANS